MESKLALIFASITLENSSFEYVDSIDEIHEIQIKNLQKYDLKVVPYGLEGDDTLYTDFFSAILDINKDKFDNSENIKVIGAQLLVGKEAKEKLLPSKNLLSINIKLRIFLLF